MSGYLIWQYKHATGACALKDLKGVERQYRLNDGESLVGDFPVDAAFHMDPDLPTDIRLLDNVLNADLLIVASLKLKDFLEVRALSCVEYLPVHIVDHKGKDAHESYFIIHPIAPLDCLDLEQSEVEENLINPGNIDSINRLVLDESRIPPDRPLFRLKGFWDITLVRRDLAAALTAGGFTGLSWLEIAEYPEI